MRGRTGAVAAAGVVASAAAAVLIWRNSAGVRRVNGSIDALTEHWEEIVRTNAGGDGVIQYVVLGDSASQGVGATSPDRGWVPLLAERLREEFGKPVEVYNFSVSGALARDVLRTQIPRLEGLGFTPDLVTLEVGGNDATQPPATVAAYLDVMEEILARLPLGSFVSDPPWFSIAPFGRKAGRMAQAVRPRIEYYGHHLLPLFDASRSPGLLRYHRYTAEDLFHPNDRGYDEWSRAFLSAILDTGWER